MTLKVFSVYLDMLKVAIWWWHPSLQYESIRCCFSFYSMPSRAILCAEVSLISHLHFWSGRREVQFQKYSLHLLLLHALQSSSVCPGFAHICNCYLRFLFARNLTNIIIDSVIEFLFGYKYTHTKKDAKLFHSFLDIIHDSP